MAELYRYAAFISYSSKDAKFARKLHRALESYGIPSSLGNFDLIGGGGKKNRIYPVFRDREELSAGQLGDQIEANLKASGALIVVCSPNGAASPWVQKEIEFFAALGRHDKIFAIIPDTAPLTDEQGADCTQACFPPAFRGDALSGDKLEPLAADARKGKDGFRNAWLKIIGGMIGVSPGQIIDRDSRRRARRRVLTGLGVATLVIIAFGAWVSVDSQNRRDTFTARANRLADQGVPLDAIAFALAGLNERGAIVSVRGDRADETVARVGRTRLIADLRIPRTVEFARDNSVLVSIDGQDRVELYDLDNGGSKTNLGEIAVGTWPVLVSTNAVIVTDADHRQHLFSRAENWRRIDLGQLGIYQLSENGATALAAEHSNRLHVSYDLAHGRKRTELGDFGVNTEIQLSADGGLALVGSAFEPSFGPTTLINLAEGGRRESLGENSALHLSRNGAAMVASGFDANRFTLYDLVDGRSRTDLGQLLPFLTFSLAGNGTVLFARGADDHDVLYEMGTGAPEATDLGDLGILRFASVSADGSALVTLGGPARSSFFDRTRQWSRTDLGAVSVFRPDQASLSANGALLAVSANGELTLFDLRNGGARTEVGAVRTYSFAASGEALVSAGQDARGAFYDIQSGLSRADLGDLGSVRSLRISPNGSSLVVEADDGRTAIYELGRSTLTPGVHQRGTMLGRSVCSASGGAITPFMPAVREGRESSEQALYRVLRGRPWNPCDWRGLGAVFPDQARGDSWFEGPRQWLRLMHVRYFGGRDWTCEETTSAASALTRERRVDMCRGVAGASEAARAR